MLNLFHCKRFFLFECKLLGKLKTYDATMVFGVFERCNKWFLSSRLLLNKHKFLFSLLLPRTWAVRVTRKRSPINFIIIIMPSANPPTLAPPYVSEIAHKSDLIKKLHLLFFFSFSFCLFILIIPCPPPTLPSHSSTGSFWLAEEPEKFWDCGNYFYLIFALFPRFLSFSLLQPPLWTHTIYNFCPLMLLCCFLPPLFILLMASWWLILLLLNIGELIESISQTILFSVVAALK